MTGQSDGWFDACSLEQLKEQSAIAFPFVHPKYGRHEVCLFWDGDGVYALENFCPHEGAMLSWGFIERGAVVCPLHAAVFDLETGECLDKYADDTTAYKTDVRDDRVWVNVPGQSPYVRP